MNIAHRWMVEIIAPIAIPLVLRLVFGGILIYASFREAGPATATLLALGMLGLEAHLLKHRLEELRSELFAPVNDFLGRLEAKKAKIA